MSSEQQTLIIVIFAVVLLFAALMIGWAVGVRRKQDRRHRAAPGNAAVPVSADPWRRFGPVLSAVYAQNEWHSTRGARRVFTIDQTFYGYGCVLPLGMLRKQLARDWGVKKSVQAAERVRDAVGKVAATAAQLAGSRGETQMGLLERLTAAGVPRGAAEVVAAQVPEGGLTEDRGAGMLPSLGFDVVRFANLVRWSSCYGYLDEDQAYEASDVLGAAAVTAFRGWDELGEAYTIGLQAYTRRGVKPYLRAVDWLRADPMSPWSALPWPSPTARSKPSSEPTVS